MNVRVGHFGLAAGGGEVNCTRTEADHAIDLNDAPIKFASKPDIVGPGQQCLTVHDSLPNLPSRPIWWSTAKKRFTMKARHSKKIQFFPPRGNIGVFLNFSR
jgi:hypothetical protein